MEVRTSEFEGPVEVRTSGLKKPVEVRTSEFEGPLDLLLHLVLRDEMDIYEVAVGDIVEAYQAEIDRMQQLDLGVATEFLLIAATLIQLKSSRLLPDNDSLEIDEELAPWSERDLLLARLLECHTFKTASSALARMAEVAGRSRPRRTGPDERYVDLVPDFLAGIGPDDLRAAFMRATAARPKPQVSLAHVTDIPFTVGEITTDLAVRLPAIGTVGFRELTGHLTTDIEVVVYFLAVLELYKRGLVEVSQATTFGQIAITWIGRVDENGLGVETDDYEG